MGRRHIWIILTVVAVFGLGLEIFKSQASDRVKMAGFGHGNALLEDGLAVYRPGSTEEFKAPIDPQPPIAQIEEKSNTDVKPAASPTPTKKLEKKPAKKDDKKKKKKKKKAVPPLIPLQPQQPLGSSESGKEASKSGSGAGAMNAGLMGGAIGAAAAPASDATPKTAKEWEDLLLAQPDVEMTEKFIKAYQTGAITSEVFYQVVTTMLESANPDIKKLAVTALGATPSVRSFETLVSIDRNTSFPSRAKSQVLVYLRVYTRLENLRILINVVTKSDHDNAVPAYEAVMLMQKSAETYLRRLSGQTNSQSTQVRGLSYAMASRYYSPVLTALKASQKWPDKTVSQAATSAYTAIAALMPTSNTQIAAGPTTP